MALKLPGKNFAARKRTAQKKLAPNHCLSWSERRSLLKAARAQLVGCSTVSEFLVPPENLCLDIVWDPCGGYEEGPKANPLIVPMPIGVELKLSYLFGI